MARIACKTPFIWCPFKWKHTLRSHDDCVSGGQWAVSGSASALSQVVAGVGVERVVAAIDVRDGRERGGGWEDEGRPFAAVMADVRDAGVERVLVTAVERDGMLAGPDVSLLADAMAFAPWEVIASGGVGTLDHLAERDAGLPAAIREARPLRGSVLAGGRRRGRSLPIDADRPLHGGRVRADSARRKNVLAGEWWAAPWRHALCRPRSDRGRRPRRREPVMPNSCARV